jgi:hypothetical protein
MAVYLLNFLSIPIYDLIIKKRKKLLLFIIALQTFLILALRSETLGVDLADSYKIFYEHYRTMPLKDIILGFRPLGVSAHDYGVESGYVLLNYIIGKLGFSFHSFLVIYAAIVVIGVSVFISRYCEDVALGFATFIAIGGFVSSFGILRQSLGLVILLFALPSLVHRKFWKYCLFVFLAGLFHSALLIAIALYFLTMLKANRALYIAMIGGSVALVFLTPLVYNAVIFPILAKMNKYYYLGAFEWNNMFAVMLLFAILIMIFYKLDRSGKKGDTAMQCGFLFALPLQALSFYIPVFSRLAGAVFIHFLCALIPATVASFETRSQKFQARTIAYTGLLLFYLYVLLTDDYIVPYVPYWAAA